MKKPDILNEGAAPGPRNPLVARLLTPQEADSVSGGVYAQHSQTPAPPYTRYNRDIVGKGGDYRQNYDQNYEQIVTGISEL